MEFKTYERIDNGTIIRAVWDEETKTYTLADSGRVLSKFYFEREHRLLTEESEKK